ncbi:hypothetical protein [Ottowia sp.]|nr:hypothetical protein [Ottowia sp.]
MKSLCHAIGAIVLILWVLGSLGFMDFYLCVGDVGTCIPATKRSISA